GFYPVRSNRGIDQLAWRRRRRLVDPQYRHGISCAAGGRLCLLDLQQARSTAEAYASQRWHQWDHAVQAPAPPSDGRPTWTGTGPTRSD
ncbi:MAG: hypothetical protein L0Y54_18965, partial [Sporichthyaceae bacterium]|nr:hypothetical protein [Sporichthyaceae bacterium]